MTAEDLQTPKPRRPLLVWGIFLLYVVLALSALISYSRGYFVFGGRQYPVPKSAVEKSARGSVVLLELVAATVLFRLRRAAVPCFLVMWVVRAALAVYDIQRALNGRHPIEVMAVILFGQALFTALLGYVVYLQRKGVLRDGV